MVHSKGSGVRLILQILVELSQGRGLKHALQQKPLNEPCMRIQTLVPNLMFNFVIDAIQWSLCYNVNNSGMTKQANVGQQNLTDSLCGN